MPKWTDASEDEMVHLTVIPRQTLQCFLLKFVANSEAKETLGNWFNFPSLCEDAEQMFMLGILGLVLCFRLRAKAESESFRSRSQGILDNLLLDRREYMRKAGKCDEEKEYLEWCCKKINALEI